MLTPALGQRAEALARWRAEQARHVAPAKQRDLVPAPAGAEAPVVLARARREPVGEGQQRVRLDRERQRRRLDEPSPRDAAQLAREGVATLGRHVLDHARAVREIELAVGEGQARGGVGAHKGPRVPRALDDVDAGDVESGLERAQPQLAAADVDDPRARPGAGEREEALVAAHPRAAGERRRHPAPEPRGRIADADRAPARYGARLISFFFAAEDAHLASEV